MFSKTFLLLDILFMLILIVCSITDMKKRIVPNMCIVLLLVIGIAKIILGSLIGYPWWIHITGLVYTVPFFIAWSKNQMGAGDVKLIIVICLNLGLFSSVVFFGFMILSLSLCIIYLYITQKNLNESVPLAPFITIGFITCLLIKDYFTLYLFHMI